MEACCHSKDYGFLFSVLNVRPTRKRLEGPHRRIYGFLFSVLGAVQGTEVFVPGIDFRAVRELVSMSDVLNLIGFEPQGAANGGLRGPCPIHRSRSAKSRSFAVNVRLNMYHCFTCGSSGNHLDLYAAFSRQGIYQAALDLCEKLHRAVPWIQPKRQIPKHPAASS